jgi:hypothetical protein
MSYFTKATYDYPSETPADGDPEILYLNLDVINNNTNDLSPATRDPTLRFNETRDAAIIKNASRYQFSIVRFTMNGPNFDLPLLIPTIKIGQPNPNLTEYEMAISYTQQFQTTDVGVITINATPAVSSLIYVPETQNAALAPTPQPPLVKQDLGGGLSRYYWIYTYQHMVDLVNTTFQTAHAATFAAFQAAWTASGTADAFPYANIAAWEAVVGGAPTMVYNVDDGLFSIYAPSLSFTNNNGLQVPATAPVAPALNAPVRRLFFDSNMTGLFNNFSNTYWGGLSGDAFAGAVPTPNGYINEILFPNKAFQNLVQLGTPVPAALQGPFWVATQDFESTSSLWSPVGAITFVTTLLPIRTEATGAPLFLGTGNLGYSSAAIQNAFAPILTDISLDLTGDGSDQYRRMIFYAPSAEYRMASLTPSNQAINSIDISVFWKNRLTGELFPIQLFNLSSVSVKCMFRRIRM